MKGLNPLAWSAWCLALLLTTSGCSWLDVFGDDEDDDEPMELVELVDEVAIEKLWDMNVGSGQGDIFNRLQIALDGDEIFVCGHEGQVAALKADSGEERWRVELEMPLSGGVGVGDDVVLLGSTDGEVVALDRQNGALLWRSQLTGEVLAAPQTNGSLVAVQTYDGKLHGLDVTTGEINWQYDSNVPVLTLRGTSSPLFHEEVLLAGFGNGKMAAFDENGTLRWETRVALAQGRSEIERMVDIDGGLMVLGNAVYAVSYQGKLAAVDVPSGRIMWQQDASSYVGVDQGFGNIYVSDQQGALMAYYKSGQGLRWEQSQLERRQLSRPTALRSYVAVADFEGYIHFISQVDGHFVGRTQVDSDGVRADMIADGNVLYVFDNSGTVSAFRVSSLGG